MTLVEVLVSTTILAMIGAVLWAGFAQTASNKKKFESQADYYQAVRVALERMTPRALDGVRIRPPQS